MSPTHSPKDMYIDRGICSVCVYLCVNQHFSKDFSIVLCIAWLPVHTQRGSLQFACPERENALEHRKSTDFLLGRICDWLWEKVPLGSKI